MTYKYNRIKNKELLVMGGLKELFLEGEFSELAGKKNVTMQNFVDSGYNVSDIKKEGIVNKNMFVNGEGKKYPQTKESLEKKESITDQYSQFTESFNSKFGNENYKSKFDYNNDGKINFEDFIQFGANVRDRVSTPFSLKYIYETLKTKGENTTFDLVKRGEPISNAKSEDTLKPRPTNIVQRVNTFLQKASEWVNDNLGNGNGSYDYATSLKDNKIFSRTKNQNVYTFDHTYEDSRLKIISQNDGEDSFLQLLFQKVPAYLLNIGIVSDTNNRGQYTLKELIDQGLSLGQDEKTINFPNPSSRQSGNRYRKNFKENYDIQYQDKLGDIGGVGTPDEITQKKAGLLKYNLGQILGFRGWGTASRNAKGNYDYDGAQSFNTTTQTDSEFKEFSANLKSDPKTFSDDFIENERQRLRSGLYELYTPYFTRPANPIPQRHSLDEMLNQNLLLPNAGKNSDFNNNPNQTTNGTALNVFSTSYLRNSGDRATWSGGKIVGIKDNPANEDISTSLNDPEAFSKGKIGGVPVARLEEPLLRGNIKSVRGDYNNKVHNFDSDFALLVGQKQDSGFSQNTGNTIVAPNSEDFAVQRIISDDDTTNIDAELYINQQYFPFMFETLNKADNVKEFCFFQATLSQMSETYTPNWAQSSYFGRTEKVHTYSETDRYVDLRFAIFASNARQLQNVIERVNWLAQQQYGDYKNGQLVSGPLLRMTIGDLYHRVSGYLRNLSLNWDFMGAGGKWEMTRNIRMPVACEVSTTFQIIHDFRSNRDSNFYGGLFKKDGIHSKNLIPADGDSVRYVDKMNEKRQSQTYNESTQTLGFEGNDYIDAFTEDEISNRSATELGRPDINQQVNQERQDLLQQAFAAGGFAEYLRLANEFNNQ